MYIKLKHNIYYENSILSSSYRANLLIIIIIAYFNACTSPSILYHNNNIYYRIMYNINRIRFIAIYFHTGGDFSLLFTLLKYSYII